MEELRISNTSIEAVRLNKSNLNRYCRLCLTENNVQPFFKLCFDGLLMSQIFNELTSLQIKADDNLPQRICIKCIEKLITSYEFIRKCQKIDEILHTFLDEKQKQEDIIINETITDDYNNDDPAVLQYCTLQGNHKIVEDVTGNCKNSDENATENCQVDINEEVDNNSVKGEVLTQEYDNEDQVETNSVIIELCQDVEKNYLDSNSVEENSSGSITKFEKVVLNLPEFVELSSFKCSTCKNCYDSLEDLNKHRRNSYKCKPFKCCCKICGKKFKTNWKLKVHERVHTDEKPYECDVCNKRFNVIQNLDRHKRIHTGEKPFLCEICGKRFTRLLTKNEHMRIHSGDKPYNCKICKVDFYRLGEFKIHMRSHECNDKTLKCPHCCKIYVTPKMFNLHIKTHHSLNKPKQARAGSNKCLLCSLCGKTFATTGNLKIHLSMHSGSMQYACEICNKRFCYKSSLVKHALIHTGERPYCCTYCKKAFVQSVHLRQHLRVHTGEKPYTCDVCGKSFALSCNLIVHKRMHTGETPYKCTFCYKGFYDSSSMKKHEKVHRFVQTE